MSRGWIVTCRRQRGAWTTVLHARHDLYCDAVRAAWGHTLGDWDSVTVEACRLPGEKGGRRHLLALGGCWRTRAARNGR